MTFIDEQAAALEELAVAIKVRGEQMHSFGENLADAKDLCRALSQILVGETLHSAFGAPGDWGYGTPIGKALVKVYASEAHL